MLNFQNASAEQGRISGAALESQDENKESLQKEWDSQGAAVTEGKLTYNGRRVVGIRHHGIYCRLAPSSLFPKKQVLTKPH